MGQNNLVKKNKKNKSQFLISTQCRKINLKKLIKKNKKKTEVNRINL